MSPLRISIVTETYVPDVNGVANSLRQLINAMDPQRFHIQIIRTRPRTEWKPEQEEVWCRGLTIPMYPDLQIGMPSERTIREAWQRFQPEFVFIATEGPLGNSALKLATQQHIPVLSAFHTNFHRYSSYYGLGWVKTLTLHWLRRFHNRTAGTLVPSEEVASFLREAGFLNVQVLPHGVDCELFHPRRRSPELRQHWLGSSTGKVLLYVGRIAAEKNIPLLLRSYDTLRLEQPDMKLVMVGDGPLRTAVQQSHPDVIWAGVQTGEALARHFASADVFVFPSLTETFGLVTLEAMASGIPVAAFDMAAAHMHITAGDDGELAVIDHEEDFIDAVRRLMSDDLTKMGQKARSAAEKISWSSIADEFLTHVNQELQRDDKQNRVTERRMV